MKAKTSRSGKTRKRAAPAPRPARMLSANAVVSGARGQPAKLSPKPFAPEPPLAQPSLRIPPVLFEGDSPLPQPRAGALEQNYPPAATPLAGASTTRAAELPAAYGTERLHLTARDPHWLYAHWDLTSQQQQHYNASSVDRHLILRVQRDEQATPPVAEIHVRPESRHWFIQVQRAGAGYVVELGYYQSDRRWRSIATSTAAVTPPDTMVEDKTVHWAKAPLGVRRPELEEPGVPLVKRQVPPEALSAFQPEQPSEWTPARERALAEVVAAALPPYHQSGSEEIPGLVGGRGAKEVPTSAVVGVSSPVGAAGPRPGEFWLSINAELVLYGATEPDAQVTIGGQAVDLRPDGTFSCRFGLPDGQHQVAVTATSMRNEFRQAELSFSRRTEYHGEVGVQPPDQALQPSGAGNAA